MTDDIRLARNIERAYKAHKLVCLIAADLGPDYPLGEAIQLAERLYTQLLSVQTVGDLTDRMEKAHESR